MEWLKLYSKPVGQLSEDILQDSRSDRRWDLLNQNEAPPTAANVWKTNLYLLQWNSKVMHQLLRKPPQEGLQVKKGKMD